MLIRVFKLTVMLSLGAAGLAAQETEVPVVANLATTGPETTMTVDPGSRITDLTILNRMPEGVYNLSVVRRAQEIAPLSADALAVPKQRRESADTEAPRAADPCDQLVSADSEAAVARILAAIGQSCPGTTVVHPIDLVLSRGEELVVTIVRIQPSAKAWVITISTGNDGKWYTTYGFTFLPNRDKRYFSRPEEEGFSIAEENDREELDFRPSILFHYQLPRSHNHSLVAGLGYDLENIAVFGGYGYTFNSNVTLTAGVAIHEQTELLGRYEVGDPLQDAIDSAQLVEKTFAPNFYLGISFRFASNVFGGGD